MCYIDYFKEDKIWKNGNWLSKYFLQENVQTRGGAIRIGQNENLFKKKT